MTPMGSGFPIKPTSVPPSQPAMPPMCAASYRNQYGMNSKNLYDLPRTRVHADGRVALYFPIAGVRAGWLILTMAGHPLRRVLDENVTGPGWRELCPTCEIGPLRETVGLVCQTCGHDYGRTND